MISAMLDRLDGPGVLRGGWSQMHLKNQINTLKTIGM